MSNPGTLTFHACKSFEYGCGLFLHPIHMQDPARYAPTGGATRQPLRKHWKENTWNRQFSLTQNVPASPALTISGIAFALYQYLGAKNRFQLCPKLEPGQITDTTFFTPASIIAIIEPNRGFPSVPFSTGKLP